MPDIKGVGESGQVCYADSESCKSGTEILCNQNDNWNDILKRDSKYRFSISALN